MQTGTIISGVAHGGLILAAFLGGLDWWQDSLPPPRITKVTLVRAAELDVQSSAAPQVPMSDIAQIAQPEITQDSVQAPSLESAVSQTVMDQTDAPDAADAAPDVSGLLQPEDPEVVVQAPSVDSLAAPNETAPEVFQPALAGNELNAPTSMSAPPPPRNAPRIDTRAAAKPPADALPNVDSTPEVAADGGDPVPAPVQDGSAPEEATTQITPDGQQTDQISAFAPQTATRPPRNPRRAHVNIPAPTPEPDMIDAVAAALQAAQEATQTTPPVVADLTGPQRAVIGDVVSQKWNVGRIRGVENYEQYVVRVAVEVDANGQVDRESIAPVEPESPTGYYEIAYRAARSAIIQAGQAGGIPLPEGKFPNGVRLVLRFDPASGEIGFN
jgi:hypothetical protein